MNTKNFSSYDLSLVGAKDFNGYSQASPEVYYFSFITSTTKQDPKTRFQIPFEDTPLLNKARAKLIGSRSGYWADGTQTDSLWFENDGVVNSVSMFGPTTGVNGADPIIEYDPKDLLITGQWYWKKINQMDHWSIVGHFGSEEKKLRGFNIIKKHISLLKSISKQVTQRLSNDFLASEIESSLLKFSPTFGIYFAPINIALWGIGYQYLYPPIGGKWW